MSHFPSFLEICQIFVTFVNFLSSFANRWAFIELHQYMTVLLHYSNLFESESYVFPANTFSFEEDTSSSFKNLR